MAVFTILVTVRDAKNKESTSEFNVPNTLSLPELTLLAVALAGMIDPLIKGQIVRVGISIDVQSALASVKAVPVAGSDVEEGAKFQFKTDGGFYTGVRLATFDEAKIASDSRVVDTADSAVATLTNALVAGITIPTYPLRQFVDKRGEDIVALETALESFLSSRA